MMTVLFPWLGKTTSNQVKNTLENLWISRDIFLSVNAEGLKAKFRPLVTLKNKKARLDFDIKTSERVV